LFSVNFDPQAVVEAVRQTQIPAEVIGADDDWRQIIITPDPDSPTHRLTMSLKTRQIDQVFFRRGIPDLLSRLTAIPSLEPDRKEGLERIIPHFSACIELHADPAFHAQSGFLEIMTIVARLVDGVFVIPAGFLDSESREILMESGFSNPEAVLPPVPEFPTAAGLLEHERVIEPERTEPAREPVDPPVARRVAERMYAMLAVAYRGVLDINPERPNRDAYLARLADWFWTLDVGHELEEYERYVLDQPLGAVGTDEAQQLSLTLESVAVLAWSLQLVEMPAHDQLVQAKRLADVLGLFREDTRFVIDSAELRCEAVLRAAADRVLAVHWRLREFELSPRPIDFAAMCRDSWFGALDADALPIIDNDLALGGQPIARADPSLRQRVKLATQHRHRAINWLCGHHTLFSHVDTST
jgi:hypothetical protein